MAQETTVAVKINASTGGTESVKSLKAQIREATNEAVLLAQKFGEFSPEAQQAAARVANLKDQMEDFGLRVKGLNPDKFTVFANVGQGIARGIQGATGAMALFGIEGENATKILAKVQGATAFAEGVQGILDMSKGMKGFVQTTIQGFKGIRGAIAATGIGLLLVALGTVVAYWDDIKGAVGGVTAEQKKLNELAEKNLAAEEKKFETLEMSENSLKLQGKSERDIQKMKVNQLNTEVEKAKVVVKNAKLTRDLEVAAAKRNKDITVQIIKGGAEVVAFGIRALAAPIDMLISAANSASEALGFGKITTFNINQEITKMINNFSEGAAKFLFNPEEVAKEGDKTIVEAEKKLLELTSKRDGILLEMRNQDIEAAKAGAEAAAKLAENQRKAQIEVAQLQAKSLEDRLKAAEMAWAEEIKGEQYKGWTLEQIKIKHDATMQKITDDYNAEVLAKQKAQAEKELAIKKKRDDDFKAATEKEFADEKTATENAFATRRLELERRNASAAEFDALEIERIQRQIATAKDYTKTGSQEIFDLELELAKKRKEIRDKELAEQEAAEQRRYRAITEGLTQANDVFQAFAQRRLSVMDEQFAKEKMALDNSLKLKQITEADYEVRSLDMQKKFDAERNATAKRAFEINKKVSLALAIMQTAQAVTAALTAGGNPIKLATGAQFVEAGIAAAVGAANIAKILATRFEGAGSAGYSVGGGGGGGGMQPPSTTPLTGGTLPDTEAGQFAGMGKVYVLEGDITKTQTRVRRVRNVSVV